MLAHSIPDPTQLFLLSIDVANLVIGIFVFLKNPRGIVNRTFFLFVLGTFAWAVGISFLYLTHNFIFDKLILGGGLFMLFGLTLFARVFPSESQVSLRFYTIFIPLLIGVCCLPFNLFIRGIVIDGNGFVQPINGPLFPLYVAITISYVIIAIYFFIRSFRQSVGNSRMQMLYFSTGITIFIVSLAVSNVILPALGIYRLNLIGPAASFIFMGMTSYTIMRHQLMDIRVVIQRGSIYSVLLSIILTSYLAAILVTRYFFEGHENIADPILDSLLMIFGIITIPRIEKYFRKITNPFFFKESYEYTVTLENLAAILNTSAEMEHMIQQLLTALDLALHPETIEFFHAVSNTFFSLLGCEIPSTLQDIPERGTRISVITKSRTIGIFTLGAKRSGDPYTDEDRTLLRTFATQAAIAFEKAELYLELQEYSKSLEEKVQARTQKLAQMHDEQRQLFDDISHALQTPLTILKGALELSQMEKLPNKRRTFEVMEHSVDDLSRLIRDIMQLARIDGVPYQEEKGIFNMSRLIETIIEYVEVICYQADIRIISHITPDLEMIGSEKEIEEIIINILSNAVHYTGNCPVREIHIELTGTPDSIELRIRDTGVGITKERLPHIFERFYRTTEHDTSKKVGYGLGLAIVKRTVENHGGTIAVESELAQGTSFIMNFQTIIPALTVVPGRELQA